MMTSLITPVRVIPRLIARDVGHVVNELTRMAVDGTGLNHEVVRNAVLECGEASCFGFGRGVAVPHAMIPGLERPIGVFAGLRPAQDFGGTDDIPADLVFLLLSPDGDDPTHLRALACAVRRLRDREIAARLRSAEDAEVIYIVLTSDVWREPGAEPVTGHSATRHLRGLTNGSMYPSLGASC